MTTTTLGSTKKFRQQRIVHTQRGIKDMRRYLKVAYGKGTDLHELVETLSCKDRQEAERLSIYDDEIEKLFRLSLDMAS